MLDERGLVPHPMAARIASGIEQVITKKNASGSPRSADYLDFEPKLIAVVGEDASRLHMEIVQPVADPPQHELRQAAALLAAPCTALGARATINACDKVTRRANHCRRAKVSPALRAKIFLLPRRANQKSKSRYPVPPGGVGRRRGRGAGRGGRVSARDERADAYGEIVWVRRPGAGVKFVRG